jgi:hypothetical protein
MTDLTRTDLERILTGLDPGVVLAPPRILRRVIKKDRGLGGLGLRVPHRKSYVIARQALLTIAGRHELGLSDERTLPDRVILLPEPDRHTLRTTPGPELLREYWRWLFHARVHVALREAQDRRKLSGTSSDPVQEIGLTAFAEIKTVLQQENFLLPPADERTVWEEFASLYLELQAFARPLLERYFPAADLAGIDRVLARDVDAKQLLEQTRPPAAADPSPPEDVQDEQRWQHRWLLARAGKAVARGNNVRAALCLQQAVRSASSEQQPPTQAAAHAQIDHLADRLIAALELTGPDAQHWRTALHALLPPAAQGLWPAEARLLYDLQKVCIDHEQELYTIDVVEWIVSLGRQPLKQPLPNQRLVLHVRNLRKALHRVPAVYLPDADRRQLGLLVVQAIEHAEKKLRDGLRPKIRAVLDKVGLIPTAVAETLARDKLIEELLDNAAARGFLNMGDLRDAIARNRLKLPDLTGPRELLRGDPLIRANRKFAEQLAGVYRRGEIYLRGLQRFSSVFFGTLTGRWLFFFAILPALGSVVTLKFAEEVVEISHKVHNFVLRLHGEPPVESAAPKYFNPTSFTVTALIFLGLLHWPALRRVLLLLLKGLGFALRWLFRDLPLALFALPWLRAVFQSWAWLVFYQFLLKPLMFAAVLAGIVYVTGAGLKAAVASGGALFLGILVLLNTRLGMAMEEAADDAVVRAWDVLRHDLVPGIIRFIVWFFAAIGDMVNRFIYQVDERLRFRDRDGRLMMVVKPVLGLIWFFLAYVIRFAYSVLFEPQANPIKHFPVVTVSHKILLLLLPLVAKKVSDHFGISHHQAEALTGTVFLFIPGIFGFLAWELKENWKLYRTNQSPTLDPVLVGSHGETVVRLLRPGFHSGTIPKAFARLRRNLRRNEGRSARFQRERLYHIRESVLRFVERDLLAVLTASKTWAGIPVEVASIQLATHRLRIELASPPTATPPAVLELEEQGGWLLAGVNQTGWLVTLDRPRRKAFRDALVGFYKLAGVHLVREMISTLIPPGVPYTVTPTELIPWPAGGRVVAPVPIANVLLSAHPIAWKDWVAVWQRDRDGKDHESPLLPALCFLPVGWVESSRPTGSIPAPPTKGAQPDRDGSGRTSAP